jgi:two-component system sensor histidine kinase TctE
MSEGHPAAEGAASNSPDPAQHAARRRARTAAAAHPALAPSGVIDAPPPNLGPKPARSLFGQIMAWVLMPLLLLWPLGVALTYPIAQAIGSGPFDRSLEVATEALADQVRRVGTNPVALADLGRRLVRSDVESPQIFQVRTADGENLAGDPSLPMPRVNADPTEAEPGRVYLQDLRFFDDDWRVAYTWVELPPKQGAVTPETSAIPAFVLVQVAESSAKRRALAREILQGVSIPQLVMLPIAVLLIWLGLARGIQPLDVISDKLRNRGAENFTPIDLREAPTELAPLVAAFNNVLVRLDENIANQRRFVADAAHQLKTPLAGLRMQAELALRESSREELERSLKQIARGSQQASRLATQLLSLARAENQSATQEPLEPVDLVALASEVTAEWVPEALQRGHDLGFETSSTDVRVRAAPTMLRELLKNLIDNALRYTPTGPGKPPGHITVRVWHLPVPMLEVEDSGPGIPEPERERVLEPFYRILGGNTDGSGLGLSIVREIARQHDAELQLLSPSTGASGLIVRIIFITGASTEPIPHVEA